MAKYICRVGSTLFISGLLVLAVLSVIGMVYLSQMVFSKDKLPSGNYCGNLTETQRNIARISMIALWLQFAWIILGSFYERIWSN